MPNCKKKGCSTYTYRLVLPKKFVENAAQNRRYRLDNNLPTQIRLSELPIYLLDAMKVPEVVRQCEGGEKCLVRQIKEGTYPLDSDEYLAQNCNNGEHVFGQRL